MNLEEAIEILSDLDSTLPQSPPEQRRQAVRLGIEALKRIQFSRETDEAFYRLPLPGETKE